MSDKPSNVVQISYKDSAINDFHKGVHDLMDTLPPNMSVAAIMGVLELIKMELFSAMPLASDVEYEITPEEDGDHTSPLGR